MNPDLIFIKLGGAAITFKDKPNTPNMRVIRDSAHTISEFCKKTQMLIGHGGGSFPHPVAAQYKVQEGLSVCGAEGFVKTHEAAAKINEIVMKALLEKNIPALSIQPSACTIMRNGMIEKMNTAPIKDALENDLIPVLYGDVILDTEKGCSIASTEMLFDFLSEEFGPSKIIMGTDVDGVYTQDPKLGEGKLIKEITPENIGEVLEKLSGQESTITDVTGSMHHKVKQLYALSQLGFDVQIISLLNKENLRRALEGEKIGTIFKWAQKNEKESM